MKTHLRFISIVNTTFPFGKLYGIGLQLFQAHGSLRQKELKKKIAYI